MELTLERGRLMVKEACAELCMCRDAVCKHFRAAGRSGKIIRYGNLGLFRDYRATIDFDLNRLDGKLLASLNTRRMGVVS
ncbi:MULTISPECIES: hypothetical protein [Klebsiella pneumoniae complex]|uniref:hypothetical protein n=1 Tax=Klebsiella pneumoniae complex TaxID=3390273 RepID=UPI00299CFB33|nr:hypothetical protein [Klebsiella variicola]